MEDVVASFRQRRACLSLAATAHFSILLKKSMNERPLYHIWTHAISHPKSRKRALGRGVMNPRVKVPVRAVALCWGGGMWISFGSEPKP